MRTPAKPLTAILIALVCGLAPPGGAAELSGETPRAWGLPGQLDRQVIEQYLSALDSVRFEAELEVGGVPGDSSPIGLLLARHGTVLQILAEFDAAGLSAAERQDGAVIRRLKVGTESGEILRLGPLTLKESEPGRGVVWLGPAGELCLGVDLEIGWLFRKNFREELCIEAAEVMEDGAVEFHSRRRGLLAKWAVPELRINREGVVEKKGLPFLRWIGGWRPLDPGAPRIPMPLPFHDWPIHLPDLLDWLPVAERAKQSAAAARKPLPPIAVPAMTLRLDSRMERGEVTLDDPAATLQFSEHQLRLEVHGGFDGRTFATDAERRSSLEAGWTVGGAVDDDSLGRLELGSIRIDLEGGLDARLPLEAIEQRQAEVEFGATIDLALAALDVRTEEGLAVSLPSGLEGQVRGRGFASLVAGETTPRVGLSRDSSLALQVAGPLLLDRPAPAPGPAPLLRLPTRLHLVPASAERPLLSFAGRLGSAATTDPAEGPWRNLLVLEGGFQMAAVGRDRFGLRAPGGLEAELAPGAGIRLAGELEAELGFEGLQRLAGARLDLRLEMPADGGEFRMRTRRGIDIGGRLGGSGRISVDTGPMTGDGGSVLTARAGKIAGELPLELGRGEAPSALFGDALLQLGGGFGLRLDPERRKAEPRQPLLVGPVRADLTLGIGLTAGLTIRPAEPLVPIVLETPVRMELKVAGELGPGAEPQDLGELGLSIERWSEPQGR